MARRKSKKESENHVPGVGRLKDETVSWIFAVSFFVLFTISTLAPFGMAGSVGDKMYYIFHILFGLGYFLIPISFILLSISFAKSIKHSFGLMRGIGSSIFFLSSLALLDLTFKEKGGVIGKFLHKPLVNLFESYATSVILGALIIISILVMFDTSINLSSVANLFRKKQEETEEGSEEGKESIKKDTKIINNGEVVSGDLREKTTSQPAVASLKKSSQSDENDINIFKNTLLVKPFSPPPLSLLERDKGKPEVGDIKANANIIKRTLQKFGIVVDMDEISIGPSITRYALKPAEGVKLSKIIGLQNNLELALAAHPVRIEAPIPGKSLVGIEIPNVVKTTVGLASLLSQSEYTSSEKPLMVSLGKSISGNAIFANLAKMPHLLIAGTTGSGKSVTIHAIINSLLFRNSPENLKFIMIDPKRVELTQYNKIPHLLTPVITDAKKAIMSLKWAGKEMDRRYNVLEQNRSRDIESYHKNIITPELEKIRKANKTEEVGQEIDTMPYIVVVIDELADIMQAYPRELEAAIVRLAQMSRAVGIHLILSTQRPSVNVITGLIKANVPTRIALQVASQFDSRTILDTSGAEKLMGAGDMLYLSGDMSKPIRLQSPYISESEVRKVTEYLIKNSEDEIPNEINLEKEEIEKNALFESMSDSDGDDDDLYEEAREIVIRAGKASTSYLQRKLRIGYARAARLIDILEEKGVIGEGSGAKPREVLIKPEGGDLEGENNKEDDGFI